MKHDNAVRGRVRIRLVDGYYLSFPLPGLCILFVVYLLYRC